MFKWDRVISSARSTNSNYSIGLMKTKGVLPNRGVGVVNVPPNKMMSYARRSIDFLEKTVSTKFQPTKKQFIASTLNIFLLCLLENYEKWFVSKFSNAKSSFTKIRKVYKFSHHMYLAVFNNVEIKRANYVYGKYFIFYGSKV